MSKCFYFYPGPTPLRPPNLWHRLSTWLAEQGPPCACDPGLLREGSRLYSYLLRGNITALKPHNLLPHPAGSTFWRRPSRSPPTLATGRQSHMAQLAQGRGGAETVAQQERPVPTRWMRDASSV